MSYFKQDDTLMPVSSAAAPASNTAESQSAHILYLLTINFIM